jgi:hypothetical protein
MNGKSKALLVALTLLIWWGGSSMPGVRTETPFASDILSKVLATPITLANESSPSAKNDRPIVSVKPAVNFPRQGKYQVGSALNVSFPGLNRKSDSDNVLAAAAGAASFYSSIETDRFSFSLADHRRPFAQRYAYLQNCAFLI